MYGKRLVLMVVLALCACDAPVLNCEQRIAAIDTAALVEREYDGPVGESAEGARIVHGYDDTDTLRQVTVTFYGERGRREIVYALASPDTYTMTVNDVAYGQAISPDRPTEDGAITSRGFAVCDGALAKRPAAAADDVAPFVNRLQEFIGVP